MTTLSIPEKRPLLRRLDSVAWSLAVIALGLAGVGLTVIKSASAELAVNYMPRQALWVLLGLLVMVLGFLVSYKTLLRMSLPLYGLGAVLLLGVLLFGHEAGGARSWIGIGGLGGQPADFMKLATVLVLVSYLGGSEAKRLHERELLVAGAIVALPAVLIVLQPDLGSSLILLAPLAALVWVAGLRWRTLAAVALLLVVTGALAWSFVLQDYQRARVITLFSPGADPLGAGYQIRQSKIAVGSGELLGKGYMQGTQSQLRFLPALHTDFAFAVLAEERGFLGVLAVLGLYVAYLWNGLRVACRARDRHAVLLVVGLLSVLAFHMLYNTAMMIGLMPVTGIPIPFLSYGGSFTLFCFLVTGLILGVDFRRWVNR